MLVDFGCYSMLGELNRMTQIKIRSAKGRRRTRDLHHPVLMAADILLYQSDLVPVGETKQHGACRHSNKIQSWRGETKVPEPFVPKVGARIKSLTDPESKMSKSDDDPQEAYLLWTVLTKFLRK